MEHIEYYFGELESLLENIISWKYINPEDIKRTQFNKVFHRIEEYSKSYPEKDDWQFFINKASALLEEVKTKLIDMECKNLDERYSLLNDIEIRIHNIFIGIKPNKPVLTTQAKIVLLHYLGALKPMLTLGLQNQQLVTLVSLLLERDATNLKKAMNRINSISHGNDVPINPNSLNNLKEIAVLINSPILLDMIETDMRKIEEGK